MDFTYADIAAYLAKFEDVHVSRQAVRAHCLAAANNVSEPAIQQAAESNRVGASRTQQQVPRYPDRAVRVDPSASPTPGESDSTREGTHPSAPNAAQKDVLFRHTPSTHVDYDVPINSAESQAESPITPVGRRLDTRLHEVVVTSNPAIALKSTVLARRFEKNGKPADAQPLNTGNTPKER
ncbi:hypothetical protein H3V53_39135 [Paraburkholderia bengalensis]|uniref:Uncharacterized protein n=1 Tax=Paraburkholderia bengalensis TaxID=2747562 RepID=A0ABU8J563_9BURK